jgi:iron complex outermembrane receptor protein
MEQLNPSDQRRISLRGACAVVAVCSIVAILCAIGWPTPALGADPAPRLLHLSLDELSAIKVDTVYAASKFTEKVTDAPSSVTIVVREEIQRFGYRTLGDVIRSVRSFDVTYDRAYSYTGVRGFNSLGDYGSRTLLLIDGHRMNDPIFDTAAVGTEGLLDVDLIERVEFIRGPGSAIYGSNAFFGVINVVTRSGASVDGVEASAQAGSLDTYRGRVTIGKKLPNGIEYLFSGTYYNSNGQARIFYEAFNAPETNNGVASNRDGDGFASALGKVSWGDFTLQGGYVTRDKDVPTGSFGSVFNVPNTTVDSRGYLELRYAHETVNGWSLNGRLHYDTFD